MPLTKQLIERAEREKLEELEAPLPPAGRRSGEGSQSVLPHLAKAQQAKPAARKAASSRAGTDKPSR